MSASATCAQSRCPRKFRNRLRVEQLENRTLPSAGLLNVLAETALGRANVVLNQAVFTPSQIRLAHAFGQLGFATDPGTVIEPGVGLTIRNPGRALSKQPTLGDIEQIVYSLPSTDFNDVTSGANLHPADTGNNPATGIGTPIANLVVRDLVQNNPALASVPALLPVLPLANFVMAPFSFIGSLMPLSTGSNSAVPFALSLLNAFSQSSANGTGTASPLASGTEPSGMPLEELIGQAATTGVANGQAVPLVQNQPTYILANSNIADVFFNQPPPDTMPMVGPDDEPARAQPPDQSAPSTDAPADLRSGQKQEVAVAKSAAGASDDDEDDEDENHDWFWDANEDDWMAAMAALPHDQTTFASRQGAANHILTAVFVAAGLTLGAFERRHISKSKAADSDPRRI